MATTDPMVESSADRTGSISNEVVLAVARATNSDPTELDPLYEVVDPDALDQLFQPQFNGTERRGGRVMFSIDGCEVTVHANGDIDVTPLDDSMEIGSS